MNNNQLSVKLISVIEQMILLNVDNIRFDDPYMDDPTDNLYVDVETSNQNVSVERMYNLSKSLGTENIQLYVGKNGICFYMTLNRKEWIND